MLTEPNYEGNIIVILANLPDFLRKPILKKRMSEFYSMPDQEQHVLIENALEAAPTIPFPNFSKLFKTWLEVLADETEEHRNILVSGYVNEITNFPQKLIAFNLDGMLEIYLTLDDSKKMIINNSLKLIIEKLESDAKRKIMLLIPNMLKNELGV